MKDICPYRSICEKEAWTIFQLKNEYPMHFMALFQVLWFKQQGMYCPKKLMWYIFEAKKWNKVNWAVIVFQNLAKEVKKFHDKRFHTKFTLTYCSNHNQDNPKRLSHVKDCNSQNSNMNYFFFSY